MPVRADGPGPRPTHWPAVLAAVAGGVAIGLNVGKVPLALPVMRAEFGLSLVQAGAVSSMLSTLAVTTAIAWGLLAGRIGALRLVLIGLLLGAGASLLAMGAPGYGLLIATRVVEGAGFLAVAVAAPALVSAASAPADRRFALGVWATYMPAGAGLAMALSPLVMGLAGWRGLWALAAFGLLLAAAAAVAQRRHYAAAGGSSHGVPAPLTAPEGPLGVLRRPLAWVLSLAFGCWALQHFALIVWMPTFLKEQRGLGDALVAGLTATMLLACVPGNLIGGALVQRGFSRGRLVAAAHVGTGLCGLVAMQEGWPDLLRYAASVALSFIGGLIPAAVMSSSTQLARDPRQIGVLQGLIMQGSQLGQFIGTPLIAAVVAASGQWASARWVTGGAAVLGLGLGLAAHRLSRGTAGH